MSVCMCVCVCLDSCPYDCEHLYQLRPLVGLLHTPELHTSGRTITHLHMARVGSQQKAHSGKYSAHEHTPATVKRRQ